MKYGHAVVAGSIAATVSLVAGCAGSDDSGNTDTVTVFAAASLKDTFTELGDIYEDRHPGKTVRFTFAGSSDLVTQLGQGAPGDVFASADTSNMDKAVDGGLVDGTPTAFATNTLTIVTAPGNPNGISGFADLANPDIVTVVCAQQVPCGNATGRIEEATGTVIPAVSEESAVTDVLGKVTSGQADAGLVYVTDAASAQDRVTAVPFPESAAAVNTYPIATLTGGGNTTDATAFVDLVTSDTGRDVLTRAGFAAP